MPKLPTLKSKELIKVLERVGFCFARQKGSHRIYTRNGVLVVVPWHNKDLKKGLVKKIIKDAKLSTEEFIKLIKK